MSDTPSEAIQKNPKTTFLTATTTGLETVASLITDETWRKIAHIGAPLLALFLSLLLKNAFHQIECYRGIKIYKSCITELEQESSKPHTSRERKAKIGKEIEKLRDDIIQLKKSVITIIIR
jgi:hypothetical protein